MGVNSQQQPPSPMMGAGPANPQPGLQPGQNPWSMPNPGMQFWRGAPQMAQAPMAGAAAGYGGPQQAAQPGGPGMQQPSPLSAPPPGGQVPQATANQGQPANSQRLAIMLKGMAGPEGSSL